MKFQLVSKMEKSCCELTFLSCISQFKLWNEVIFLAFASNSRPSKCMWYFFPCLIFWWIKFNLKCYVFAESFQIQMWISVESWLVFFIRNVNWELPFYSERGKTNHFWLESCQLDCDSHSKVVEWARDSVLNWPSCLILNVLWLRDQIYASEWNVISKWQLWRSHSVIGWGSFAFRSIAFDFLNRRNGGISKQWKYNQLTALSK